MVSHALSFLDHELAEAMDKLVIVKSPIYTRGVRSSRAAAAPGHAGGCTHGARSAPTENAGKANAVRFLQVPVRAGGAHAAERASRAEERLSEKVILACLVHDCSAAGFIRGDHGYWAAQLIAPYVDEEVAFAVRYHQVLRFYPDEAFGYKYPDSYIRLFGADYKPEPYLERAHEYCRNHKWYKTARLLTVNDLYSFDPNLQVELEEFTDIVGRNFRQPEEGLGFDDSPSAHMWRTINWPTRYL